LYIGIVILLVNIMSYIFLYLNNKEENRKNKYARSIYFGQISSVFIGLLTTFFVAGFGCESLSMSGFSGISSILIKWIALILVAVFGVIFIKRATDDEDWFGGTKEENENN
jgi:uncharacterized membrane protein